MVRTLDAAENGINTGKDDAVVGNLLFADSFDRLPKTFNGMPPAEQLEKNVTPTKLAEEPKETLLAMGPIPSFLFGDRIPKKPETPKDIQKKEADSLAATIKSFGDRGLNDTNKESIHAEFYKQLEKTKDKPSEERATALRRFVDDVNTSLRSDSKFSFSENPTGVKDKLSFSLVDKGEGSLEAGVPKRTVYDTKEYSLRKGPDAAENIPDREKLPLELRNSFDYVMKQSRDHVMQTKFIPALDAVSKELGFEKLKTQEDLNKALGLSPEAPTRDYYKRLETLMMNKLGLAGQDYQATYSADVSRAFIEQLKLKPGIATKDDILKGLKETKVPKDFKLDQPPAP
jgi:hypothetical protein